MAERWISEPLELPLREPSGEYPRVDLVFHEIDHSGPSFEARIYIDNTDADESSPTTTDEGYAGSFWIFGHGGCFGDIGHCDVQTEPRDVFDRRAPHQLTPHKRIVTVNTTLEPLADAASTQPPEPTFVVTVVAIPTPIAREGQRKRSTVLDFRELSVVTYM